MATSPAVRPSALPFPEAVPLATHYRVESKLGMRPVLHCTCCGASIPFSQTQHRRPGRELQTFLDKHNEHVAAAGEGNADAPDEVAGCTQDR